MKSTQYGCTIATAVAGIFALTMSASGYAQDQVPAAKVVQAASQKLTAEQKAEAVGRMDIAKRIIANLTPEATQLGLAPEWKQATMNILLRNSSSKLTQIAAMGSYQATIDAATTGKGLLAPKVIGSTSTDLVFVPWTPCRYVDTRVVGGKIAGTRGYDLSLNGATYGGVAGCAPTTLAGVGENSFGAMAMNITIVDTSTAGFPGFAAARPVGSTALTSLVNWFSAGATVAIANAAIVQMDQGGSLDEFEIVTSGPVQVVIDLFGAFTSPTATALQCSNQTSSVDILNGNNGDTETAACTAGFALTGGGCDWGAATTGVGKSITLSGSRSAGQWACSGLNNVGGTRTLTATAYCCRIPGH